MDYRPAMSDDEERRIRAWHDTAYESIRDGGAVGVVEAHGLTLDVPADVIPPARMSLGPAVIEEVREGDRVLDMGTGCGVNAILAAARSTDVLGVDINPHAVAAATANASRNGVEDRTTFRESDVFATVNGTFDLIIFDPPFRWFAPRDHLEAAMADENYQALNRFLAQAAGYLTPGGRILMFFGTSGDLDYLYRAAEASGWARETVWTRDLTRDDQTVSYVAFRLIRRAAP